MTKQEIRALTLCALAPAPGEHLWDVGGGSGTVAIEWMRTHPRCTATTFEKVASRVSQIGVNALNLGVPALNVKGAAPEAFADEVRRPDAVFVGGGVTQPGMLEACWGQLSVGGRLVANAVTAESESLLLRLDESPRWDAATLSGATRRAVGNVQRLATATSGGPMVRHKTSAVCRRRHRYAGGIHTMTVHFIGAGPGAADLITVRAQRIIAASPVCLYAGSLVPAELLEWCPVGAQVVDTARLSLDEITAILVEADSAGLDVARLHSGDPSIFSAVAEQARRLDAAGVDFDMIPGVPAFTAAAAALGRELTVPGVSQTIVLTRVSTLSTAMPEGEDLRSLGRSGATMVIHLGAHRIEQIASELADNYGEDCPVAVVAFASRPEEIVVRGTLKTIVELVHAAGITKTAVVIVGRVLTAEGFPDSYLYSAARERSTH